MICINLRRQKENQTKDSKGKNFLGGRFKQWIEFQGEAGKEILDNCACIYLGLLGYVDSQLH